MYDITLIGTRHQEAGACTLHELWQILENLAPEVIFQEMPPSQIQARYFDEMHNSLETDAVRFYMKTHQPIIVAVDIDDIPDATFFREHRFAVESVERLADINGLNYRKACDNNSVYTRMYGFEYLNSDTCSAYYEAIRDATEKGLKQINDDKLNKAYQAWVDVIERRENEMLQNIYDYSKDHVYNRSVFLLGAGHRKSIIDKIERLEKSDVLKLNWFFYGSQATS